MPDGALEVASNVVISKDGIISKRRGFYDYYDGSTNSINGLAVYQDVLLSIFVDRVGYLTDTGSSPNYTGTLTTLSGVANTITAPRRTKTALSNKNLYWTTDNGVLKLEAYNGTIYNSGAPQALDLRGAFYGNSGPILANQIVGWRVIFGRRDANDNLILSSPSETLILDNAKLSATYTRSGGGPYTVTVTTTSPHGLSSGAVVTITDAVDTDANGSQTITVIDATSFSYSVSDDPGASGSLSWVVTRSTRIEASIPSEINSTSPGWFFQIYRSSQVADSAGSIFSDFKLIDERTLSSAEISARVFFYNDDIDDILLGEELYTNQNSREGEDQANFRAPKCDDLTLYKGNMIYGACTTRQLLQFNVIDTSVLGSGDFIDVKSDSTTRRYIARTGVANQTVSASSITSSSGLVINYTAHGFSNDDQVYISNVSGGTLTEGTYYVISKAANTFKISTTIGGSAVAYNSETGLDFQGVYTKDAKVLTKAWVRASNVVTVTSNSHGLSTGFLVYVTNSSGGTPNVTSAVYLITVTGTNTFTFAETAADDASGNTLDYEPYYPMFDMDNSSSASLQLAKTAKGIVKAVNRDSSALVYASYISGISDIPGKVQFQAKGFGGAIYVRAETTIAGTAFSPAFPNSFTSGAQVYSRNSSLPNVFMSSKFGEPEAVPLVNQFPVGAANKSILRVLALRDSIIVLKEDGVYRVTGDNVFNFSITALDTTVICKAAHSAVVLNNQVLCLTNQGVCLISESSVAIISRIVEDVIQPVLGASTLSAQTGAFSYESERFYGLTTILPNGTTAAVSYVYNVLNNTWVSWDELYTTGVTDANDVLHVVSTGNKIRRERKNQTRIDFCGQNYTTTIDTVGSDQMSARITVPADAIPVIGDILVKSNVFTRITSVTEVAAPVYDVTFERISNVAASDSLQLYKKYDSQWKNAPFHAGLIGRMKQFAQMQLHFRDNSVSELEIVFAGDTYGSSESTTWDSPAAPLGFGDFPWGFEPWGLEDGVNIQRLTSPAPICRIYVPRYQQRGTFIQPIITHKRAGESHPLQAMSFAVRAYAERVSR